MSRTITATALAVAAISSVVLAGCTSPGAESSVDADCVPAHDGLTTFTDGVLTVGVPENPPYTQTDGDTASGIEIDIIEMMAEAECLDIAYVPITYANGIPMISEQRRTDLVTGGWYVTAERAEQVGFTSPTMYDTMGIVSADGLTTVEELESAGAVGTGTGFSWNEELAPVLGDNLREYPGTVEIRQDLLNGRLQVALDGYAVAVAAYSDTDFEITAIEPDDRISVTVEQPTIAFPIDPDNGDLSDALSELIDTYREDGTLIGLLAEYDLSTDLLVPAEVAAESIR